MKAQPQNTRAGRPSEVSAATADVELLQAIAAGSEPAFAELRGRYRAAVARVCATVGDSEREDCEQEVFARLAEGGAVRPDTRQRRRLALDGRPADGLELPCEP